MKLDWKFPFGVLHLQASSAMSDRGDILKLYSIAWIEIRKEKCWCGSICRFSSIYSFIEDFRFDRREKIITKMKRKSPKWQFLHKTKRRRNWKFEFFTFVVVWFALFASGSIVLSFTYPLVLLEVQKLRENRWENKWKVSQFPQLV